MKRNTLMRDSVIVGLALFATFFGAGNLVFPPYVGLLSGSQWAAGAFGLFLTAIVLPVAGLLAVNNAGTDIRCLMVHAHPKFYVASCAVGWFFCALGSTIPKVAATTHEVGVASLFPNLPIGVTLVIFFALLYFFARQEDSVIDKVGKYLTPILVIVMAIILFKGVFFPAGEPAAESSIEHPMPFAMLQGYLIGDLTLGLMASGLFINTIKGKGYSIKDTRKGIMLAGLVCIIIMTIIYTGLTFIGAIGGSFYTPDTDRTVLLSGMVNHVFGKTGQVLFGTAVSLACLTTGVSVATGAVQFFYEFFKQKISYNTLLLIVCIIGMILGATGVTNIINYVTPIFLTIYPPFIVFTFLGIFDKFIPNDGIYKGAVFTATLFGLFDAIMAVFPNFTLLSGILSYIPLYSIGFAWLIPTILVAVIMGIVYRNKPRRDYDLTSNTIVERISQL